MKDTLRPILELLVVLPGLLLGYFPVKTYLKQSPGIRRSGPPIFYLSEQYRQIIRPAVQYAKNLYHAVSLVHTVEDQLL